jgi:hypothetical protein
MSSTEAIQRAETPTLQVEISTMAVSASTLDPSVGQKCLQVDLDMAVGVDASSLDPKAARILPEMVATTWAVHRLWEVLPTASRVPGYSKKHVTPQPFSVSSVRYMRETDVLYYKN